MFRPPTSACPSSCTATTGAPGTPFAWRSAAVLPRTCRTSTSSRWRPNQPSFARWTRVGSTWRSSTGRPYRRGRGGEGGRGRGEKGVAPALPALPRPRADPGPDRRARRCVAGHVVARRGRGLAPDRPAPARGGRCDPAASPPRPTCGLTVTSGGSQSSTWPAVLGALLRGEALSAAAAAWAMDQVMSGEATSAQIAGFVVALRAKGETADEMAGLSAAMLDHAHRIEVPGPAVDVVGTGGDLAQTVNVSTMA